MHPRPVATVLRNVTLHDAVHALDRPRRAAEPAEPAGPSAAPAPQVDERQLEEAFRQGYERGLREGRDQQRLEARETLERAAREAAQRAHEEARAAGQEQGLAEGRAAAREAQSRWAEESAASLKAAIDHWQAVCGALQQQADQVLAAAEDEIVAIVFEATCKLLGERAADPALIRARVAELVGHGMPLAGLRVHLHPADFEAVASLPQADAAWQWVADEGIALGGVVIRHADGRLDARLDRQVQVLRQVLAEVRAQRASAAVERGT